VETAIGVFATRELGQDAMRQLIEENVPHESIVFLSRSEPEVKTFCKHLGATIGGYMGLAVGMTMGVGAAVLLALPATWHIFALGFGSAALVGVAGAGAGALMGNLLSREHSGANSSSDRALVDEETLCGDLQKEWRSLIVVRTQAQETAQVACRVLGPSLLNAEREIR
jgi:hypothetical protein